MTEDNKDKGKKVLSLAGRSPAKAPGLPGTEVVRQSFSHGRSKTVAVEVKKKRGPELAAAPGAVSAPSARPQRSSAPELTDHEREARARALRSTADSGSRPSGGVSVAELNRPVPQSESRGPSRSSGDAADNLRRQEMEELRRIKEQERHAATLAELKRQEEENAKKRAEADKKSTDERRVMGTRAGDAAASKFADRLGVSSSSEDERGGRGRGGGRGRSSFPARPVRRVPTEAERAGGRVNVEQALSDGDNVRVRSMASMRRRAERARMMAVQQTAEKIVRDVVIPEVITVQELANRMAERAADVIKSLMKMGVMATINQNIDADTAELIVGEFGHKFKRVTEADVLTGLSGEEDASGTLLPRPPVVTIMGHVDHGKTSLLDAIRKTNVVKGEAGGITQHIGAYQIELPGKGKVTFIDTPGHAAFSEMRARGANVTDIVVLVVAANDGIMPQTIEAIKHAKAAEVPIIVAINKIDLPQANPQKVRETLLQHELVVEEMGGEVLNVEVSAKTGQGLEKLLETILLQAEVLELKANPNRMAQGAVIEAKLEKGRGSVATVLVQKGTLNVGDIFVAGAESGRVRALLNDKGENVQSAPPAMPVEVLGLQGTPVAGDDFTVVENEARAREVADFRGRKKRELAGVAGARGTLDQMFAKIQAGEMKELPVIIKGDVHGSVEAIAGALEKLANEEKMVRVRVLHAAVGAITESDITLANTTRAIVIGFNVRPNPQARELAKRDAVEIRYYSIIYEVIDEIKNALSGLLAPTLKETFLGNAVIRKVFDVSKVGKVAGCMVTEGLVKRGAGVRLLRDNVVIHTGKLKTLKRMKDEVKEVKEGYECGMAFENYEDIREGDTIEAYQTEEVAQTL